MSKVDDGRPDWLSLFFFKKKDRERTKAETLPKSLGGSQKVKECWSEAAAAAAKKIGVCVWK